MFIEEKMSFIDSGNISIAEFDIILTFYNEHLKKLEEQKKKNGTY